MNNFDFLSVGGTAINVVSFANSIWSRHRTIALSQTGNRGHGVTRPNNSCKGDNSKQ